MEAEIADAADGLVAEGGVAGAVDVLAAAVAEDDTGADMVAAAVAGGTNTPSPRHGGFAKMEQKRARLTSGPFALAEAASRKRNRCRRQNPHHNVEKDATSGGDIARGVTTARQESRGLDGKTRPA